MYPAYTVHKLNIFCHVVVISIFLTKSIIEKVTNVFSVLHVSLQLCPDCIINEKKDNQDIIVVTRVKPRKHL